MGNSTSGGVWGRLDPLLYEIGGFDFSVIDAVA